MSDVLRLVVGDLQTNCYLTTTAAGLLVIDPGGDAEAILAAASEQAQAPPAAILLTHGHFDHTGAATAVAEALGVPVYAHAGDRRWLEGEVSVFGMKPPPVEVEYFDDESLPRDLGVTVIATPGHSPGSVTYVTADAAFVGDTLFAGGVGRTDLPGGKEPVLMASLRRLLERLDRGLALYPGHGPATTLAAELRGNPWVQEAVGEEG